MKRYPFSYLWLCLLLSAVPALSQNIPLPTRLPNDMSVLVRERHNSPLVAIELWVRGGTREEREGENGCAHFLEHLLFKGSAKFPRSGDSDFAIENLGATLNAATGPDYARFTTTVAPEHLTEALSILADVVRNATLPETEVNRERGVLLDELARYDSDPDAVLLRRLYALAFPQHPYRFDPAGQREAIKMRGRDTLAEFYRRCYQPARCILVLVGGLTPERGKQEALRAFGDWSSTANGSELKDAPENPSVTPVLDSARKIVEPSPLNSDIAGLACLAPPARSAQEACIAQIVAALLGDADHNGRLARTIPAGIQASARYTPRQDASLFILTAVQPAPDGQKTPLQNIALDSYLVTALQSLQTQPATGAEIAAAKGHLLGRLLFERETNGGLARATGYAEITKGDSPELFQQRIQQITSAEINGFIKTWLTLERSLRLQLNRDATGILLRGGGNDAKR